MDPHIFHPFKARLAHQTLKYHTKFLQLTIAHCFFKELPNNLKKCLRAQHHTMTTAKHQQFNTATTYNDTIFKKTQQHFT